MYAEERVTLFIAKNVVLACAYHVEELDIIVFATTRREDMLDRIVLNLATARKANTLIHLIMYRVIVNSYRQHKQK